MEATPAVNEDDRKLFVGGLPQEASDEDIKEYFGQYGEIDNVNLKMDPQTGRSRGFAFILFKENTACNAASAQEAHVIKVN
jgi:RNA recognition motif-containing protein